MNWDYLLSVLKDMAFGRKWLEWIGFCISNVRFSILVNCSPEGFFSITKRIKTKGPTLAFPLKYCYGRAELYDEKPNHESWIRGFKVLNNERSNL